MERFSAAIAKRSTAELKRVVELAHDALDFTDKSRLYQLQDLFLAEKNREIDVVELRQLVEKFIVVLTAELKRRGCK
jgi:hypothetical protein